MRYELPVLQVTRLKLPEDAEVRHVAWRGQREGCASLWIQHGDISEEDGHRFFTVIPTGIWFEGNSGRFVGTAVFDGEDPIVLHVFEVAGPEEDKELAGAQQA